MASHDWSKTFHADQSLDRAHSRRIAADLNGQDLTREEKEKKDKIHVLRLSLGLCRPEIWPPVTSSPMATPRAARRVPREGEGEGRWRRYRWKEDDEAVLMAKWRTTWRSALPGTARQRSAGDRRDPNEDGPGNLVHENGNGDVRYVRNDKGNREEEKGEGEAH